MGLALKEVADRSGFGDPSRLYFAFVSVFGKSPPTGVESLKPPRKSAGRSHNR